MKNRDISALFETAYANESDALFRFCLLRVSSKNQAIDITQETFLRFWQVLRLGQQEIDNVRAFLFTIARHLIIDWYRKKKTLSLETLANERGALPPDALEPASKQNVERDVEGRQLFRKLRDLAPSYRDLIYLRFIKGLPLRDIATRLGISANAVSLRIRRGLKELKRKAGY